MNRRALLRVAAGSLFASVAGCLSDDGSSQDADDTAHDHEHDDGESGTRIIENFQFETVTLSGEFPIHLYDTSDNTPVARYHGHSGGKSNWHRSPIEVPFGALLTTRIEFYDQHRERIPIGPDGLDFAVSLDEESSTDVLELDREDDLVIFQGKDEAEAAIRVDIIENGTVVFTTNPCPVQVVE
jgi:hypothetical protein